MEAFLLLVMLTACAASPQELSGKMFTFPEETETAHVKMELGAQNIDAATVCFRFITNLKRVHSLFSLATSQFDNHFLIFKDTDANTITFYIKNKPIQFEEVNYELNKWHSVCTTWDGESGLGQLWFDGKNTVRMFYGETQINQGIVVLGQEQDVHGGKFEASQSFVGMMTDVNMWNYVLPSCKIKSYMKNLYVTPGNVLNWGALTFQSTGRVLIEDAHCQK